LQYRGRRFQKRKYCKFCAKKFIFIDYKDIKTLRYYVTERGKIMAGRMTGTCAKHQRELTMAIKRARNIAFLPFVEK
jgi:small subunit ribosomal protein S18